MSNQLAELIDLIQFKTHKNLDQIAESIGYSRPYLSKAKKGAGDPAMIIGKLKAAYASILPNDTNGNVGKEGPVMRDLEKSNADILKDLMQLKAANQAIIHFLTGLLAEQRQIDPVEAAQLIHGKMMKYLTDQIGE